MIKLSKILKHKKKPESKFNRSELVIYNPSEKPGDKFDELYIVKFRRFGKYKDNPTPQWYYSGSKLKLEETSSKGLPYAPFFRTGCVNTPEEYLHKLYEIRGE